MGTRLYSNWSRMLSKIVKCWGWARKMERMWDFVEVWNSLWAKNRCLKETNSKGVFLAMSTCGSLMMLWLMKWRGAKREVTRRVPKRSWAIHRQKLGKKRSKKLKKLKFKWKEFQKSSKPSVCHKAIQANQAASSAQALISRVTFRFLSKVSHWWHHRQSHPPPHKSSFPASHYHTTTCPNWSWTAKKYRPTNPCPYRGASWASNKSQKGMIWR